MTIPLVDIVQWGKWMRDHLDSSESLTDEVMKNTQLK